MDFYLNEKEKELKQEFEKFFKEEMKKAPDECKKSFMESSWTDNGFKFHRYMAKKLGEKGWLSLAWPLKYGGRNASIMEQLVFNEAREACNAPGVDIFGVSMFAPTLLAGGTEEQKQRLLPPIAKGEVNYCQGWSEPDSGSDLSSLATTAVRDGDEYVINGTKIWTTGAHRADYMFLLARTDLDSKRSNGLSIFNVKMDLPGLEVRPLLYMDRRHIYNQVFFKDVRVHCDELIGKEGEGWNLTRQTMNFERSGVGMFTSIKHVLEDLVAYMKTTKRNGRYLSEDPTAKRKIAKLFIDIEVGKTMAYKVAWFQNKNDLVSVASTASCVKLFSGELLQRLANYATEIMGLYGQLEESKWAPLGGKMIQTYQLAAGFNIAGGTSEIQRNLIAWVGVGLPRFK